MLGIYCVVIPNFQPRDDGLSYLLPNIIVQGKTLFERLSIPQINFYQLLGHPLLPQNQNGVFYIPHYIFYVFGALLGNYDIGALFEYCFHVIVSAITMYLLLGLFVKNSYLRTLGSLSYAFSGLSIVLGSNWPFVTSHLAYYPLLLYFLDKHKLKWAFFNLYNFTKHRPYSIFSHCCNSFSYIFPHQTSPTIVINSLYSTHRCIYPDHPPNYTTCLLRLPRIKPCFGTGLLSVLVKPIPAILFCYIIWIDPNKFYNIRLWNNPHFFGFYSYWSGYV